MRLPRFDVVFRLAAPAIDILVKSAGIAVCQICDDEARVRPLRANLDARDDPLDAAPARGAIVEGLEATGLILPWCDLVKSFRAGLEAFDMTA